MTYDSLPDYIRDAIAGLAPASEAPAATPEPEGLGVSPVNREAYPVILGWEPNGSNWRYDGDPVSKAVASVPVCDGCGSSRFGDVHYFRSMVIGWRRGKLILTPEGVEFLFGKIGGDR